MNIDKIVARIPALTRQERESQRANAEEKLNSGDLKWATAAPALLAALDAHEDAEARSHAEARATRLSALENSTTVERIIAAFQDEPPTPTEEKLVRVLLDHPGGTCAELSTRIGWDPVAWDMHFGAMCSRRVAWLWPLEPAVRETKDGYIRLLTIQQKDGEDAVRYTMKPEAVAAFAFLNMGGTR